MAKQQKETQKTVKDKRKNFCLLKVELLYIKPAIWRRIVVPSATTLGCLNLMIQAAMGWDGYHMYSFEKEGVL